MRKRVGLALCCGVATWVIGCGGAPAEDAENAEDDQAATTTSSELALDAADDQEPDAADDQEPGDADEEESDAADLIGASPSPGFPAYIIYVEPVPGRNPLFAQVRAFKRRFPDANDAALYPTHVSITHFFHSSLSQLALAARFQSAVNAAKLPFGQPTITKVHCHKPTLVDLHVKVTQRYRDFRSEVRKKFQLSGQATSVGGYHISLFETDHPSNFPKAAFKKICKAAHATFDSRIANYNKTTDGHPYWRATLYYAPKAPTPTSPLGASNLVTDQQINPKLNP